MNILFLTLLDFSTLDESGIYTDLMREFINDNHKVYIISPTEKRKQQPTSLIENDSYKILKLQIGNTQKTNVIEKGISTLTLESRFQRGIKDYFSDVKFDLVIYTTPPITLQKAIEYVKKRDNAMTYLLLKDIFPQNAVDLGMVKKTGVGGLLYKYFKSKEKRRLLAILCGIMRIPGDSSTTPSWLLIVFHFRFRPSRKALDRLNLK